MLIDDLFQILSRNNPRLSPDNIPLFEKHKRRDVLNPVSRSGLGVFVNVYLDDSSFVSYFDF
jgi:hypothetical protein